jgi:hypothetical protein
LTCFKELACRQAGFSPRVKVYTFAFSGPFATFTGTDFYVSSLAIPSLLLPPDFVGAGFQVGFGMAYGTSAAHFS